MTPKTAPCFCTANALAEFVRRVAHIDLESALHNTRPFSVAKRGISTSQTLQSQQTSHYEASFPTASAESRLRDSIPFDQVPSQVGHTSSKQRNRRLQPAPSESLNKRIWKKSSLGQEDKSSGRYLVSEIAAYKDAEEEAHGNSLNHLRTVRSDNTGPSVPDLTPETVDALAVKSLEHSLRMNPSAAKSLPDASQRRPYLYAKRPMLHFSFRPVTSISKAREDKKRVRVTAKPPVPNPAPKHHQRPFTEREPWQIQKAALKEKFKEGWNPRRRLSPDALAGIRAIHAQFPEEYTTSVLAKKFEVSPEAIRRILKSRWIPKEEEMLDRQRRWFLRGQRVWNRYAELGLKPPARWRKLGIGKEDDLAVGRQVQSRVDTNITTQSARDIGEESGEI